MIELHHLTDNDPETRKQIAMDLHLKAFQDGAQATTRNMGLAPSRTAAIFVGTGAVQGALSMMAAAVIMEPGMSAEQAATTVRSPEALLYPALLSVYAMEPDAALRACAIKRARATWETLVGRPCPYGQEMETTDTPAA